ncbi:MAG: acetate/propionate family kinase [Fimbriimonadaceae bacterium]
MPALVTINGGSSSIRFALYTGVGPKRIFGGKVERIGLDGTMLSYVGGDAKTPVVRPLGKATFADATQALIALLEQQPFFELVEAIGHRVVNGMGNFDPAVVTSRLVEDLRRATPYDPDHLPSELKLIEAFAKRYPTLPQVACFDTAFHRTMPRVATLLPIPRRYDAKGVQRYGFHGLSYSYLMEELERQNDPAATDGAVILAHLGNGASLAAVRDGKSIDTSMGFTPASGLVMSTRSGDLDPGIEYFLSRTEGVTPAQYQKMTNHESGLLGVSETSSDMRDLLECEPNDERAAEAVALFCYTVKKWIGSFAAALGGIDTLVFAGGIGENAPAVRERICRGLGFLGLELDATLNAANAPVISPASAAITARVIRTDEELMIARSVARLLNPDTAKES